MPSTSRHRGRRRTALIGLTGLLLALSTFAAFASALTTVSAKLVVFRPTNLPGCREPGATTLIAAQDSYVDQNAPTSTNGSSVDLFVLSKTTFLGLGGDDNRRTYVSFTLPSLPEACVVTSASLRLFAETGETGRTIQVFRASGAWSESAVTWNNQPGGAGAAATVNSGTGWLTWSVTAHVQQMYTGSNNGFMVRDQTENDGTSGHSQNYRSSEDTLDRPELIVTIGNPP